MNDGQHLHFSMDDLANFLLLREVVQVVEVVEVVEAVEVVEGIESRCIILKFGTGQIGTNGTKKVHTSVISSDRGWSAQDIKSFTQRRNC